MSYIERVEIGDAVLYHGDCLEVMPTLGNVDAVVTDPPYGVGFKYLSYEDTPEQLDKIINMLFPSVKNISSICAITPGVKNMFKYPQPDHVGCFFYPSGAGLNSFGFTCWQPILFYGKDPYAGKGSRPDGTWSTEHAEKNGHPCPKPIKQMKWLTNRVSLEGWTILDPFMGSGTTGVAAVQEGRKFIGVELEKKYFDIACQRIEDAQRQVRMF